METTQSSSAIRRIATREVAFLVLFLFLGLVIVPLAVFYVGEVVFGQYDGGGFNAFYLTMSEKIRNFDRVAWFLALAPYIGWQLIRLMAYLWRRSASLASS